MMPWHIYSSLQNRESSMKKSLMTLALVAAANTGYAHDQAGCQKIGDLLARLSCYDENHDGVMPQASAAREDVQATQARGEPSVNRPGVEDSSFGQASGLLSNNDNSTLQATLTEIFKHPKKMTRLYLDNGQIWGLVKERMMSASAGDSVEMKPGTMGGYRMSINGGSWFRVKRFK